MYAALLGLNRFPAAPWVVQRASWHAFGITALILIVLSHDVRISLAVSFEGLAGSLTRSAPVSVALGGFLFVATGATYPTDPVSLVGFSIAHLVAIGFVAIGLSERNIALTLVAKRRLAE